MSSSVIFLKCYFCQKNFNKDSLIDVNSGFVTINDENLEIKNLIFDTCFTHVDESTQNYICHGCNNNLVSFHMFKRDVKKYTNFIKNISLLEVLYKLEEFLLTIDDINSLSIMTDSSKWSIQLSDIFKEQLSKEELIVYDPEIAIEEVYVEPTVAKKLIPMKAKNEEKSESTNLNELESEIIEPNPENWQCVVADTESSKSHLTTFHKEDTDDGATEDISEMDITDEYDSEKSIKRRKLNTLSDLKEEQINWIRKQVKAGEIFKGRRKCFKCSICQIVLCTQASLVRHLRDLHVLKNPADEKSILKEEVNNCKITTDTETYWKCSKCEQDRIYKSEQSFKLHFRMTHIRDTKVDSKFIANCRTIISENEGVKDVWKCPECLKIFRHRDGLRNHLKTIHPKMLDDFGSEVEESFLSNKTVISQSRISSKNENGCDECGVKFLIGCHHVKPRIHKECHEIFKLVAPHVPHYKCDQCRIIFSSENSLYGHLENHDNQIIPVDGLTSFGALYCKDATSDVDEACLDEAVWKCGHCSVKYFDENDCVAHQLLLHTSTMTCFVDNREFHGLTGLSKYLQHMKNKHPELFPDISYACSSCKLEFPTIYEKLAHQKVCDLKKYECDFCSKRYSTKHQLQAHILFEVGITGFSCEKCGKKCKTMSDLRIHYNTHSGLRPYSCSLCEKSFKTPAARSTHLERHTLEEGITCEICGTKLTNRSLYQRHKRYQHDQEFRNSQYEKNSCNLCAKSFLRTSHFKQHLKQQHGIS